MHFSIAPVEVVSQMHHQFEETPDASRKRLASRQGGLRRRVSLALHGLTNRLEPAPMPAH